MKRMPSLSGTISSIKTYRQEEAFCIKLIDTGAAATDEYTFWSYKNGKGALNFHTPSRNHDGLYALAVWCASHGVTIHLEFLQDKKKPSDCSILELSADIPKGEKS